MSLDSPRMGNEGDPILGHASAAFAMSAAVTILFNTALAWAKEAYPALTNLMNTPTGSNWTTQGLANGALFFGLGLIFLEERAWLAKICPNRLILVSRPQPS